VKPFVLGTACRQEEHAWCQSPDCQCSCHPRRAVLLPRVVALVALLLLIWAPIFALIWVIAAIVSR